MRRFTRLVETLETTSGPAEQISLLTGYFRQVPDDEKTVAIRFLYGAGPRGRMDTALLKEWAMELSGIPEWLLAEAGKMTGNTAETLALVLPGKGDRRNKPLVYWAAALGRLSAMDSMSRKTLVCQAWQALGPGERFIFNKLLCGKFRSPVSTGVLIATLSQVTGIDQTVLTWRIHRYKTAPDGLTYPDLATAETAADTRVRPYPFPKLAAEINQEQEAGEAAGPGGADSPAGETRLNRHWLDNRLGPAAGWSAQRKWAGIPAQIVCREGQLYVWAVMNGGETIGAPGSGASRHRYPLFTELVTGCFPEFYGLPEQLPDGTVLEGELLGLGGDRLLPAFGLEKRIGRKSLPKRLIEQLPAAFLAYDCLEYKGQDVRAMTWARRRQFLDALQPFSDKHFRISPQLTFQSWRQMAAEHDRIRDYGAEGFLLNSQDTDVRWLWKAAPYTFRAVLLYARSQGGGNPYTQFSLGAWEQGKLLSFTTVASTLSDDESEALAAYIHENTTEKYGPVRTVKPGIVFEIAFDDVLPSARHRSGLRLRGARMLRWLKERSPEEAGMLKSLRLFRDQH